MVVHLPHQIHDQNEDHESHDFVGDGRDGLFQMRSVGRRLKLSTSVPEPSRSHADFCLWDGRKWTGRECEVFSQTRPIFGTKDFDARSVQRL
jgi:hypothetical protein